MRLGHVLFLSRKFRESADAFSSELAFLERLDHALRSRIRIELHMRLGAALQAFGDRRARGPPSIPGWKHSEPARPRRRRARHAYYAGAIHALRGEVDPALELLESALEGPAAFVRARARIEPEWDNVRNDARFARLMLS
jgi:hypothetical protein